MLHCDEDHRGAAAGRIFARIQASFWAGKFGS
jgi:hypothetical protein